LFITMPADRGITDIRKNRPITWLLRHRWWYRRSWRAHRVFRRQRTPPNCAKSSCSIYGRGAPAKIIAAKLNSP
jgi:hypothetical protein